MSILGWVIKYEIYNLFSIFVFIFSPSLFKAILKPAELLALWNVVSSTSVYQQFVPHFVLSIFTCIYLRLRISLIVACGIASERLALTARFEAVLDNEGKRLDASLSNSIRHSIFGYIWKQNGRRWWTYTRLTLAEFAPGRLNRISQFKSNTNS